MKAKKIIKYCLSICLAIISLEIVAQSSTDSCFYANMLEKSYHYGVIKCKIKDEAYKDSLYYLVGRNDFLRDFLMKSTNLSQKIKREEYSNYYELMLSLAIKDEPIWIKKKYFRSNVKTSFVSAKVNYIIPDCAINYVINNDSVNNVRNNRIIGRINLRNCDVRKNELIVALYIKREMVRFSGATGNLVVVSYDCAVLDDRK